MSYIRGQHYTYEDCNGMFYMFNYGFVPKEVVDAFVLMRFVELKKEKKDKKKAEKFLKSYCSGNIGADEYMKEIGEETSIEWLKKRMLKHEKNKKEK